VNDDAIAAFAESTIREVLPESLVPPFELPLKFKSVDEELNVWFLLQLINIGSGFRDALHAMVDAGAWDTMLRGILGIHITGRRVNADFLSSVDANIIQQCFGFPIDREVEVMPAVHQTVAGPLRPLADHLVRLMNEAGQALRNRAFEDFASFLRAGARAEKAMAVRAGSVSEAEWRPSAAAFVQRLASTFPGFKDIHSLKRSKKAAAAAAAGAAGSASSAGSGAAETSAAGAGAASAPPASPPEVYILKKAQLCAAYLHRRFAARLPEVFAFPDVPRLTVMSDNVLPAVLRAVGVLVYAPALAAHIDAGKPLPAGDQEVDIRAAAVVAGERLAIAIRTQAARLLASAAADTAAPSSAGGAAAPEPAGSGASTEAPTTAASAGAEGAGVAAAAPAASPEAPPPAATAAGAAPSVAPVSLASLQRFAALTEADLDEWLWYKGKEPALRKLRRHATPDTYFY